MFKNFEAVDFLDQVETDLEKLYVFKSKIKNIETEMCEHCTRIYLNNQTEEFLADSYQNRFLKCLLYTINNLLKFRGITSSFWKNSQSMHMPLKWIYNIFIVNLFLFIIFLQFLMNLTYLNLVKPVSKNWTPNKL